MTEIAKLGEFGLIRHLTEGIKPKNASTLRGVGDDCAVMHYPDKEVLVTTDLLMEGVHFDLTYTDLRHLGYKAAQVNISDVFAMNGTPRQLTVSLALSKRFTVEDMDELYAGLRAACDRWGVDIVGGDTTSSFTGLAISITCIGEADAADIVYRDGARDTDLVCVSGDLGAAYMGLQLLEREKSVYYQQVDEAKKRGDKRALEQLAHFQPDFAGREYLLQRQLEGMARGDIIARLREAGVRPTAMMDISDGLSSELTHICTQSHVGCRIYEKNLPIDYQTAVMAEELNMNVTTCALNGGEDYELLFTVPIGDHEKIEAMDDVKLIGHITKESLGRVLVSRDGNEFDLKAQGWNPLKSTPAGRQCNNGRPPGPFVFKPPQPRTRLPYLQCFFTVRRLNGNRLTGNMLQHGPFGMAKQPVSAVKTGHARLPNGPNGNAGQGHTAGCPGIVRKCYLP